MNMSDRGELVVKPVPDVKNTGVSSPPIGQRLSTRVLVLTALFVMISASVIFMPAMMRYRYLQIDAQLASAHTAGLTLTMAADRQLSADEQLRLLRHVGMYRIEIDPPDGRTVILSEPKPPYPVAAYVLPKGPTLGLLADTVASLFRAHSHVVRMIGPAPRAPTVLVDVVLDEAAIDSQLRTFTERTALFLMVVSTVVAAMAYFVSRALILAPLRRLTGSMIAFRSHPDDPDNVIAVTGRRDEIGVAETELAAMQSAMRQTLGQRGRLAALGEAMSKINHDLRGILSTARLISDRLTESDDPIVKRSLPPLLGALDRAVRLCKHTLDFAAVEPVLKRTRFPLRVFIDDVAGALMPGGKLALINDVSADIFVHADRDQFFRAFSNLLSNSLQARARRFSVGAYPGEDKGMVITVTDDGAGISEAVQADLFQPFAGRVRSGGTGLGLAIVREVIRGHGGTIALKSTGPMGTVFEIVLPRSAVTSAPKLRAARRWGALRTIDGSKSGERAADGRRDR